MDDYLLKLKFLKPENWHNISGLIAEIDKENFYYFLEDVKFEKYFVFFKDINGGEYLKKGDYIFLFVWDYYVGSKQDSPGILGYFTINNIEYLKNTDAWRYGDERHSTFNDTNFFNKYFQQDYILRFEFSELHYVKSSFHKNDSYIISYKELLIKYLDVATSLSEKVKESISFDKIGNTYIPKDICEKFIEIINKSNASRKVSDGPADIFTDEFEEVKENEPKNEATKEINKIRNEKFELLKKVTKK
ncbi:MAG: hypothetical protein JXA68_10575 [Ignavibacteriales bacterium]|nr:hypothetical protein [Ignavibacteriales bacterium]